MTAHPISSEFKSNATKALADPELQKALGKVREGFIGKRLAVVKKLPEFEALRDSAREIKDHTLAHLDLYLERYEAKVVEAGGKVPRPDPQDLPGCRGQNRHQGQVDDLGRDRDQHLS
jgi:L-lactate dehydrogenase complex protein LldF